MGEVAFFGEVEVEHLLMSVVARQTNFFAFENLGLLKRKSTLRNLKEHRELPILRRNIGDHNLTEISLIK